MWPIRSLIKAKLLHKKTIYYLKLKETSIWWDHLSPPADMILDKKYDRFLKGVKSKKQKLEGIAQGTKLFQLTTPGYLSPKPCFGRNQVSHYKSLPVVVLTRVEKNASLKREWCSRLDS